MLSINQAYKKALLDLYFKGLDIKPRGFECKELQAYKFQLESCCDNIITIRGFETDLDFAKQEFQWYLAADNRIDWSPRIKRVWNKYSDDKRTVNSNCGERLFGKHKIIKNSQWEEVKEELKKDPDSRRAIFNLNSYFDKENPNSLDIPCTIAIQAMIRSKKLDFITYMRSNDIYTGFRNDVYCFTEFQKKMAGELAIEPGKYFHIAGSLHLYAKDYEKVNRLINEE